MNVEIRDSRGETLRLTQATLQQRFDAVTCSPRTDRGFGFSLLHYLVDREVPWAGLEAACAETGRRREVCVLPKGVSSRWRVLLTPTIRSRAPESRLEACRLMRDLLAACRSPQVGARSLLITHFHYAFAYPEPHVAGILDAIEEAAAGSFGGIETIGFDFIRFQQSFERDIRERFHS